MDIYELKFTKLQQATLRFLFVKSGMSFTGRAVSKALGVSATAVAKSLTALEREDLVKVTKDKDSGRLSIQLNRNNPRVFYLKRVDNLKLVYESGLVECLENAFPSSTIVLFGSYSYGEDITTSDIDLAIIGTKAKEIDLGRFERLLERKISLNFYESTGNINKNLKDSIINGIVLKGAIRL